MQLYDEVSYELGRVLTLRYSTSFSQSTRLFPRSIRPYIFSLYAFVRIADEIVDTYRGVDAGTRLDLLEQSLSTAIQTGYSENPIVHAFARTIQRTAMPLDLVAPFFQSMRMDVSPSSLSVDEYRQYIYGSAEVIGLMCLWIFCDSDTALYERLTPGAQALGSAYQKINFLRDIRADTVELGRMYFPSMSFDSFSDKNKKKLVREIRRELEQASEAIRELPHGYRRALVLSYRYYLALLNKIDRASVETMKQTRLRLSGLQKFLILLGVWGIK